MILNKETIITQQSPKQLRVVRHFDADLPLVWDAWTKKRFAGRMVGAETL